MISRVLKFMCAVWQQLLVNRFYYQPWKVIQIGIFLQRACYATLLILMATGSPVMEKLSANPFEIQSTVTNLWSMDVEKSVHY